MRTHPLLLLLASCAPLLCFAKEPPHRYDQIAPSYLATYPVYATERTSGLNLSMPSLSERTRSQLGFSILKDDEQRFFSEENEQITVPSTWEHLDLFSNSFQNPKKTVVAALDRTHTTIGRLSLTKLLTTPTIDIQLLKKRQAFLQRLLTDDVLYDHLSNLLAQFAPHEDSLLSLIHPDDPLMQDEMKDMFYTGNIFAASPTAMAAEKKVNDAFFCFGIAASTISILSIITIILINTTKPTWKTTPILQKVGVCASPLIFVAMLWYEVRGVADIKKAYLYMKQRLQSCYHFITLIERAKELFHTYDMAALHGATQYEAPEQEEELATLNEYLRAPSLLKNKYLFDNATALFGAYPLLKKHTAKVLHGIHLLGTIDAYLSLAKLLRDHQDTRVQYSFASYLTADSPYISATNFWHPSLPTDRVVTNSIELGSGAPSHSIVATGINAGGKSTTIKALTLCLLFGQTIGIVPAEQFTFTPFTKINTFLNIKDNSGADRSLFQAELDRALQLVEDIKKLPPHQFSFTLLDEIFTGTERIEGEAGAYGVARRLSDFDQNMTTLATHFKGLTTLEEHSTNTSAAYRNMKVIVEVTDDGSFARDAHGKFIYPYKLLPGISNQQIALDILAERNFDPGVIAIARDVLAHPEKYTPTSADD